MARPVGRRTKLTPENHKKIIDLVTAGNYAKVAIEAVGINADTYYEWLSRGKTEQSSGKTSIYTEFSDAIAIAEAKAEVDMVVLIKRSAVDGSIQAAQWFLERKHADRWGKNDRLKQEITGAGGSPLSLVDAKSAVMEFLQSRSIEEASNE